MKVAVIGNGNVGMATFRELQRMYEIQELVLIGRNLEKIAGEIEDFRDADCLSLHPTAKLSYGGYDKVKGADIILYTAGAAQKPGQSRLDLVQQNAQITKEIFEEVKKYNDSAIIVALSNPVDIITLVIQQTMGTARTRVIGTGTLLDTTRLKRYISTLVDVSFKSTEMFVLGEHGDSSCIIWSAASILGMSLDDYFSLDVGEKMSINHSIMSDDVRKTAAKIIAAKGYTAYGVAAAAARVVSAIINDTHEIFPISLVLQGEYGVQNVAISVPCMIGKEGIISIKQMKLTEEEKQAFAHSAKILSETAETISLCC